MKAADVGYDVYEYSNNLRVEYARAVYQSLNIQADRIPLGGDPRIGSRGKSVVDSLCYSDGVLRTRTYGEQQEQRIVSLVKHAGKDTAGRLVSMLACLVLSPGDYQRLHGLPHLLLPHLLREERPPISPRKVPKKTGLEEIDEGELDNLYYEICNIIQEGSIGEPDRPLDRLDKNIVQEIRPLIEALLEGHKVMLVSRNEVPPRFMMITALMFIPPSLRRDIEVDELVTRGRRDAHTCLVFPHRSAESTLFGQGFYAFNIDGQRVRGKFQAKDETEALFSTLLDLWKHVTVREYQEALQAIPSEFSALDRAVLDTFVSVRIGKSVGTDEILRLCKYLLSHAEALNSTGALPGVEAVLRNMERALGQEACPHKYIDSILGALPRTRQTRLENELHRILLDMIGRALENLPPKSLTKVLEREDTVREHPELVERVLEVLVRHAQEKAGVDAFARAIQVADALAGEKRLELARAGKYVGAFVKACSDDAELLGHLADWVADMLRAPQQKGRRPGLVPLVEAIIRATVVQRIGEDFGYRDVVTKLPENKKFSREVYTAIAETLRKGQLPRGTTECDGARRFVRFVVERHNVGEVHDTEEAVVDGLAGLVMDTCNEKVVDFIEDPSISGRLWSRVVGRVVIRLTEKAVKERRTRLIAKLAEHSDTEMYGTIGDALWKQKGLLLRMLSQAEDIDDAERIIRFLMKRPGPDEQERLESQIHQQLPDRAKLGLLERWTASTGNGRFRRLALAFGTSIIHSLDPQRTDKMTKEELHRLGTVLMAVVPSPTPETRIRAGIFAQELKSRLLGLVASGARRSKSVAGETSRALGRSKSVARETSRALAFAMLVSDQHGLALDLMRELTQQRRTASRRGPVELINEIIANIVDTYVDAERMATGDVHGTGLSTPSVEFRLSLLRLHLNGFFIPLDEVWEGVIALSSAKPHIRMDILHHVSHFVQEALENPESIRTHLDWLKERYMSQLLREGVEWLPSGYGPEPMLVIALLNAAYLADQFREARLSKQIDGAAENLTRVLNVRSRIGMPKFATMLDAIVGVIDSYLSSESMTKHLEKTAQTIIRNICDELKHAREPDRYTIMARFILCWHIVLVAERYSAIRKKATDLVMDMCKKLAECASNPRCADHDIADHAVRRIIEVLRFAMPS